MSRPTNKQLCEEFRNLLTHGFDVNLVAKEGRPGNLVEVDVTREIGLQLTREWRNKVWRAFRELEDRLCPLEALDREKDSK